MAIYNALLYMTGWPLVLLLAIGGIYFTIRTRFVQFTCFKEALRVVVDKTIPKGQVSSFGALMISTASRVGTGNIIGVSTAICLGGPGSIFWMWIMAYIGGASAFVESTLAQIYKRKASDGSCYGGPSFYIEAAGKVKAMSIVFAIALIFTYAVGYNMLASYNLQSAFACFSFYKPNTCWILGGLAAAAFLYTMLGNDRRLVHITGTLVPVMSILYILMTLLSLCINFRNIPGMFVSIFQSAFDFKAIFGGFMGSVIVWGVKRGLYSNEAGMGSAPNAAAAAMVSHPVKQGLVQMLSVFIDTNLLCTATALMCLSAGVAPEGELAGAPFIQKSLQTSFGTFGPVFIAFAMILFAFTTLIGNFYYVENCLAYLNGKKLTPMALAICRIIGALLVFVGAGMKMGMVWDIADIAQCVMSFINIPACFIIGGVAYKCLDDYIKQRKAGINPVFRARDIDLPQKTDFWND